MFQGDATDDLRGNVRHIAAHDVTPEEAEFVLGRSKTMTIRSATSTYPITFGATRSGRYLAVVWYATGENPEIVRVITAYDATRPDRRR